ncbi:metal-dependent amidase/aminoacylase/carboxypeptidase [Rhizodiscina lignyota]|uniref:Metal-dependent amidase/aminoacylase/carboxypeptidase n=1 Tax=Rhizodiscina lignyota TaxID=1504668 RepID=A0A9P4MAT8_9PEZI|nr:metal-dependent amidase/aminoacylase/carboxypeptidase [Rhizodiscina lignyota]
MPSAISTIITEHLPSLDSYEPLYKHLHANPELSFQEKETAARIVEELGKFPVEIHSGIGGHGIAAVLKNGEGKAVLLRADFDALPVEELTGLPYASKKRMVDLEGNEKPVMHACGHDMHVACLLAATELMVKAKEKWSGTLILCFQPAEEKGAGAQAMVDDGLYDKIPKPDIVLGGHVFPMRAGVIGTKKGTVMSAADSFHITMHGRGSHGSQPHRSVDPVVMAASTVMRLQSVISRETNPEDFAVLTVGALNVGDAENVIPAKAELKINIRNFNAETRPRVIEGIKRIVNAESLASNAPAPPDIKETTAFPLTINDEDVTTKVTEVFTEHFPPAPHGFLPDTGRLFGSEDFGILGSAIGRPYCYFVYGGTDPEVWDKAIKEGKATEVVPVNHSPFFAPVIQPTMRVGVEGYTASALTWLIKQ